MKTLDYISSLYTIIKIYSTLINPLRVYSHIAVTVVLSQNCGKNGNFTAMCELNLKDTHSLAAISTFYNLPPLQLFFPDNNAACFTFLENVVIGHTVISSAGN